MMQATTEHLSAETAQAFFNALPDKIKLGLQTYAAEVDYPLEAVIEMAIASFLDEDSMTFVGCNPLAGMKFEKGES
jgi:predicted transcriptional regulator